MTFTPVARIQSVVAKSDPVRGDMRLRGGLMLVAAKAKRALHYDKGHVKVTGFMGKTDYSVTLDDTRGASAAFSIEFGTRARVVEEDGQFYLQGGTPPLRIVTGPEVRSAASGLHRA